MVQKCSSISVPTAKGTIGRPMRVYSQWQVIKSYKVQIGIFSDGMALF